MDNNCVNIVQIGQVGMKLWPRHNVNRWTTDRHTDRRTGDSYIYLPPPTLFVRGINIVKSQIQIPQLLNT